MLRLFLLVVFSFLVISCNSSTIPTTLPSNLPSSVLSLIPSNFPSNPALINLKYEFETKWGTLSNGNGHFSNPASIAVDTDNIIYVADAGNNRIQKFDSFGKYLQKWENVGKNDKFRYPQGICVHSESKIVYIADSGNNKILKFDTNGNYIAQWGSKQGSADGEFYQPSAVAVDSKGNVYVCDYGNHRVQKFTSDGQFIKKWGSFGWQDGQLNQARGITVDLNGNVYVADTVNNRVQKFTSEGQFIKKWGSFGSDDSKFSQPKGITTDALGNVYVTDDSTAQADNSRIQIFDSEGNFLAWWGRDNANFTGMHYAKSGLKGLHGDGDGQFFGPYGIAVDSKFNIYVSDFFNNRIQKLRPVISIKPTPTPLPTPTVTPTPTNFPYKIVANQNNLNLCKGKPANLAAWVEDSQGNTVNTAVITWTSDDSNIATVTSNGWMQAGNKKAYISSVMPIGPGTTKFKASYDKIVTEIEVIVKECPVITYQITILPASLTLYQNNSNIYYAYVKDNNGNNINNAQVQWSVKDTNIATIKQTGEVLGISAGQTKVIAAYNGASAQAELCVLYPPAPPPPPLPKWWAKTYGIPGTDGTMATSINNTSGGGYIVAGMIGAGMGYGDIWALKLQNDGTVNWQKRYSLNPYMASNMNINSVQQTSDGGYIIASYANMYDGVGNPLNSSRAWIFKLNSDGTINWQKVYNDNTKTGLTGLYYEIYNIREIPSGYILCGSIADLETSDTDIWIAQLDPNGNKTAEKRYHVSGSDIAYTINPTSAGGYIVGCYTKPASESIMILKIKSDLSVDWHKIYGGDYFEAMHSVQQTSDGGYIVEASTSSFKEPYTGDWDLWILKLNSNGTINWQKRYDSSSSDYRPSISETGNGGYIVSGGNSQSDIWILKLKTDGTIDWQKTFAGAATSILLTSDGYYMTAGYTNSYGTGAGDIWIIKFLTDGTCTPLGNTITSNVFDTDATIDATPVIEKAVATTVDNTSITPSDTSAVIGKQAP